MCSHIDLQTHASILTLDFDLRITIISAAVSFCLNGKVLSSSYQVSKTTRMIHGECFTHQITFLSSMQVH